MNETLSEGMIHPGNAVREIVELRPQQGDRDLVLQAKILKRLERLEGRLPMSGWVLDRAGVPMKVLTVWEDVAANEAYEEVAAAVAGKIIVPLALFALCGPTATTLTPYSKLGADPAEAAGPPLRNAANGGELLPFCGQAVLPRLPAGAAFGVGTSNHESTGVIFMYGLEPNYQEAEDGTVLRAENGEPLVHEG
jgi:hypothetical protein